MRQTSGHCEPIRADCTLGCIVEPLRAIWGSFGGLVIQLGLLEAIDVFEVLIVSCSFHLGLIGCFEHLGVWRTLFVRSIVSWLAELKEH